MDLILTHNAEDQTLLYSERNFHLTIPEGWFETISLILMIA